MLHAELEALFPASVALSVASADAGAEPIADEALFPEEAAHIVRAVAKRKHEFTAGRICARRALTALGLPAVALPPNEDRSVRWPDAVWGSITHTEGLCAAVAVRREQLRGVGIDAELRGRVTQKLWGQIASEREVAWFSAAPSALEAAERATLLFSAKEAFYKAQYCVSRCFVGFHEVELEFAEASFVVRLQNDIGGVFEEGRTFSGRFTLLAGHVVTGLVIAP